MATMNTADIGFEREIWKAADKMRGNIDASEYKSVVLGLIFRCRMFISPRKRYLYCVNRCVSMEIFLNDIFGGQTGDKISHIKRKKNNKTTS